MHIRSILRLADALKRNDRNGLRFIFGYYRLPFFNRIFEDAISADSAIAIVTNHYKTVSSQMGYTVLPPEDYINGLGYNFLQRKAPEKARAFFKLNIDQYPKSGNVYDSMGDFYSETGDKPKAREFYNKALAIQDNPDTRNKLEKLK
jgi:tetratricopeptide (TPR) repeat protein